MSRPALRGALPVLALLVTGAASPHHADGGEAVSFLTAPLAAVLGVTGLLAGALVAGIALLREPAAPTRRVAVAAEAGAGYAVAAARRRDRLRARGPAHGGRSAPVLHVIGDGSPRAAAATEVVTAAAVEHGLPPAGELDTTGAVLVVAGWETCGRRLIDEARGVGDWACPPCTAPTPPRGWPRDRRWGARPVR
ncbi:hypothetical protein ACVGOW_10325 [Pseudonocardia saturnea]